MIKIQWSGRKTMTTTAGAVILALVLFFDKLPIFQKTTPVDRVSWIGINELEKSKSDSSITGIGYCNYQTQGVQVSLETSDAQKKLTSVLRNLDINCVDDYDSDDRHNFIPVIAENCPYNSYDLNSSPYAFKTQNATTKEVVIQGREILNFQGDRHSPDEIAMYWKKDCRMWLWKSFRLSRRRNQMLNTVVSD